MDIKGINLDISQILIQCEKIEDHFYRHSLIAFFLLFGI